MVKIKSILKFIRLTLRHKWFVFWIGLQIRAPIWNLLVHDLSKFSWHELPYYAEHAFENKKNITNFSRAWNHHYKHNPHHWEYWVLAVAHHSGDTFKAGEALPMPERYVREMTADWLGVHRAAFGKYPDSLASWDWFQENINKINLHPKTRFRLYKVLHQFFKKKRGKN